MNWLFIHQNFPGQYIHAAKFLVERGENVVAIGRQTGGRIDGVSKIEYCNDDSPTGRYDNVREFEQATMNGLSVAKACEQLKSDNFNPDIIIGHNGWGEILFVKDVWPNVPLLGYFEFYYHSTGSDVDFDSEFPAVKEDAMRIRLRNAVNLLGLQAADRGQTPTLWQNLQYPQIYRDFISVVHEGVDTELVRPDATAKGSTFLCGLCLRFWTIYRMHML
jgi:hypothetical protein